MQTPCRTSHTAKESNLGPSSCEAETLRQGTGMEFNDCEHPEGRQCGHL